MWALLRRGDRLARRAWPEHVYIEMVRRRWPHVAPDRVVPEIYKVQPPTKQAQINAHMNRSVAPPDRLVYVPTASDLLIVDWFIVPRDV